MVGRTGERVAVLVLMGVAAACDRPPPKPEPRYPFELQVTATTDEGLVVPGAEIYVDSTLAGTTDQAGSLIGRLELWEGSEIRIDTRCPVEFKQAGTTKSLRANRLASQAPGTPQAMPVRVECVPIHRKATVVVRVRPTAGAAGPTRSGRAKKPPTSTAPRWLKKMPILLDGKVVSETDVDGFAHLLLEVKDDTNFELVLDTSANPRLEPQNPVTMLAVKRRDERFLIDQTFSERPLPKKPPRKKPPPEAPPPTRPTELKGEKLR